MFTDILRAFTHPSETKIYEKEYSSTSEEKIHPQRILDSIVNSFDCLELTREGIVLSISPNLAQRLKIEPNKVRGNHYSAFLASNPNKSSKDARIEDALQNKKCLNLHLQVINGRNAFEPFACRSVPVVGNAGVIERIILFREAGATGDQTHTDDLILTFKAMDLAFARIEFETSGIIVDANPVFTNALGYRLEEIVGKHHRIFCDPKWVASRDYEEFWDNLRSGKTQYGEYKRITKSGQEIWIVANYVAVKDDNGNTIKIVKYASDVTAKKMALLNWFNCFEKIQEELNQVGQQVSEASTSTVRTIQESLDKATEITANMSATAAATTEMGASIHEISNSTSQSVRKADQAVRESHSASNQLSALNQGSKKIADVARAIESIARQTNLLALNATIEASRAGEAGLGFGVVASEVKALAGQTQKATEEINQSINEIQQGTNLVISSIESVDQVIKEICDYSTSIAGAIEEQTATTSEVERSTTAIANSLKIVEHGLHAINDQAALTNNCSQDMDNNLMRLKHLTAELSQLV
jgi:methyl-accepting chemotaxis protein